MYDDIMYLGRVIFGNLPDVNGSGIQPLVAIPDVTNLQFIYFQNTVPLSVTNFTGGSQYRSVSMLGDGFTTIKNNTTIKTNTGADILLSATKIYTFTLKEAIWYQSV